MDLPKRKPVRLKNYDYSKNRAYFITVCTEDKRCILSRIAGDSISTVKTELTEIGEIAREQVQMLGIRFPAVRIDKYVIMPNHIHLIVRIQSVQNTENSAPTVSDVICVLKSQISRLSGEGKILQRSFHDHIIRSERDYRKIWKYIDSNPFLWKKDCFYKNF